MLLKTILCLLWIFMLSLSPHHSNAHQSTCKNDTPLGTGYLGSSKDLSCSFVWGFPLCQQSPNAIVESFSLEISEFQKSYYLDFHKMISELKDPQAGLVLKKIEQIKTFYYQDKVDIFSYQSALKEYNAEVEKLIPSDQESIAAFIKTLWERYILNH